MNVRNERTFMHHPEKKWRAERKDKYRDVKDKKRCFCNVPKKEKENGTFIKDSN